MRAFLAFPLPEEMKNQIKPFIEEGRRQYSFIKWVKPENLHITLLFLGNIDNDLQDWVTAMCGKAALHYSAFTAVFRGTGQFPRKGKPRVIFSPVIEGGDTCTSIYNSLLPDFRTKFLIDDKPFSPHITLGRVKKGRSTEFFSTNGFGQKLSGEFLIPRIILVRSDLQSRGPVYNEVASFVLQS